MDINVEIEAVLRAWNPGRGRVANQILPFDPLQLHDAVETALRAVAKAGEWTTRKTIVERGNALRNPKWFRNPAYTTTIRHECLMNQTG